MLYSRSFPTKAREHPHTDTGPNGTCKPTYVFGPCPAGVPYIAHATYTCFACMFEFFISMHHTWLACMFDFHSHAFLLHVGCDCRASVACAELQTSTLQPCALGLKFRKLLFTATSPTLPPVHCGAGWCCPSMHYVCSILSKPSPAFHLWIARRSRLLERFIGLRSYDGGVTLCAPFDQKKGPVNSCLHLDLIRWKFFHLLYTL